MKKVYSLALSLFLSISAFAQVDETFVFVNEAGEVVPNGTTITVNNYELDRQGELLFPSGLYVKNNSTANAFAGMTVAISKIDNGDLQHCFPGTCQMYDSEGTSTIKGQAGITPGNSQSIQSEWLPEGKGTCTVTYTIRLMEVVKPIPPTYDETAKCASVTVNYVYDDNSQDVSGIEEVQGSELKVKSSIFNLAGQKVAADYKGVIVKNGKKYLNKE